MRSAIARILTEDLDMIDRMRQDLHVNPVNHVPQSAPRLGPENASDFWIFPFFWIWGPGQPRTRAVEVYEYLKNCPKWEVGMAFAKNGPDDGLLSSRSFGILFDAANKKGRFYTGGGGIFV